VELPPQQALSTPVPALTYETMEFCGVGHVWHVPVAGLYAPPAQVQIPFVQVPVFRPHAIPLFAVLVTWTQVSAPVAQDVSHVLHGSGVPVPAEGEHVAPDVQPTHMPAWQTSSIPQGVPSWSAPEAPRETHVGVPSEQAVTVPAAQGFDTAQ
jgi:hypothetical protein